MNDAISKQYQRQSKNATHERSEENDDDVVQTKLALLAVGDGVVQYMPTGPDPSPSLTGGDGVGPGAVVLAPATSVSIPTNAATLSARS